jgi:hypothetical protein
MRRTLPILTTIILAGFVTPTSFAQTISGTGGSVTTTASGTTGVSAAANSTYPDVKVQTGDSTGSAFRILNTNNTEVLRVQANGYVGIGSTAPHASLEIAPQSLPSTPISSISTWGGKGLLLQGPADQNNASQMGIMASFASASGGLGAGILFGRHGTGWATHIAFHTHPDSITALDYEPEVMRINSDGYVGIGSSAPNAVLEVAPKSLPTAPITSLAGWAGKGVLLQGSADGTDSSQIGMMTSFAGASSGVGAGIIFARHFGDWGTRIQFHTHPNNTTSIDDEPEVMRIDGNGYVGIGVGNSSLTGVFQIGSTVPVRFLDIKDLGSTIGYILDMAGNSEIHVGGIQLGRSALSEINAMATPLYLNSAPSNNYDVVIGNSNSTTQKVTFATHGQTAFAGDVTVSGTLSGGNIVAKYQDVAEWVPASGDVPPGTVVSIDPGATNHVLPTTHAYDTAVAGVVSPQPGITLGEASDGKALVATTGRVRVRVTAERAPIHPGDLLVASDIPGMAMVSIPVDVGGVLIHRPGTVIGKALEALPSGQSEVLVLLALQ